MSFFKRVVMPLPERPRLIEVKPPRVVLYVEAENDLLRLVQNSAQAQELASAEILKIPVLPLPTDVSYLLAVMWQEEKGAPIALDLRIYSSIETYGPCGPKLWKILTYANGEQMPEDAGIGCAHTEMIAGREQERRLSFIPHQGFPPKLLGNPADYLDAYLNAPGLKLPRGLTVNWPMLGD